ncbi:MAG: amylo-alpha-1,6-glucosidase [Microbacterium sp.]|nr:MAG: amylo-alpha-1,6-glucosidase [Microbacterium sp.]
MTGDLQPFLNDRTVVLTAPTQAWSGSSGDMGDAAIDGFYHGDTRFVRALSVAYAAPDGDFVPPEWILATSANASSARFDALLRGIDDPTPDPKVRLERVREVTEGRLAETLTVRSHLPGPTRLRLRVQVTVDATPLQQVKSGATVMNAGVSVAATASGAAVATGDVTLEMDGPGARVSLDGGVLALEWTLTVPPRGSASATWQVTAHDPSIVVRAAAGPAPWPAPAPVAGADPRLPRWTHRALADLSALRLTLPGEPDDVFLAAGAPWFFTLFGRDSLWAARLLLPLDASIAASTLRVLARLQGTTYDPATAQQPGKIMHELRAGALTLPGEGIVLPPLYYGTVDATPLWVCLLADAADTMADAEVESLLPHLEAALAWITTSAGDDGFLDYVDETGHGLSNQGWKDSGDSIQWRSGALAEGPIALCEVQGYAYEAAIGGARLLDRFARPGGDALRAWAASLKVRFAERFWVTTPEGRYPAIALDQGGQAVDTLTSNIGHLLGTGILDPEDEAAVSTLLVGRTMSSGFGVRTLSTDAGGYWPLSYHGGSVWTHDTAIIARGMSLAGRDDDASAVVAEMLAAAEAFDYRVPELHAGDPASEASAPAPYPAACRPQAWSAAAAVTAWDVLRRNG